MVRVPTVSFSLIAASCALALMSSAEAQLETRLDLGTGVAPNSVVVADFNHDGKMDLAVASFEEPGEVQVFLGNGDGTFGPPTAYDAGTATGPLVVGDLNHDGNADIVVVD